MGGHFFHHAGAMNFNGLDADAKHVGDLFVELAGDDEIEHFAFALGELVEAARDLGVSMKSTAPFLSAATAIGTSPWPVTKITGSVQ